MSDLSTVLDIVKARSPRDIARVSAYLLSPGLVLFLTISGVHGRPLAIWLERPAAIAELKTEVVGRNNPTPRNGVAVILEPLESEYRIPLSATSTLWSSLDDAAARANRDRLVLDPTGLNAKTPLLGVNGPVTLVVGGELGTEIQVPGGTERVDDWRLPSRRSLSIVSSVLLACVFAFGMALVTGLPTARGNKRAAS